MKFQRTKVAFALAHVLGIGGAVVSAEALAQADIRVNVTGSSIRRVEAEGALPIEVVTKEDIVRSGAINVEQVLANIAVMQSSGGTQLSTGAGNTTYGSSTVSLRGLSADRTLVLVNGRRLAVFAGNNLGNAVNINAIPISAIERIEVLKDGASAVYGSDAIAGVVNFILSSNYQGVEAEVTVGTPTRGGGGQSTKTGIVAGVGDLGKDRFNLTLSGSYENERPLFARDREFAKTGNVSPFLVAAATGQGNIEGAWIPGTGSVAAGNRVQGTPGPGFGFSPGTGFGNPLAASGQCGTINMFLNPTNSSKGAPYCTFDSNAFVGLVAERQSTNLSGNLVWKLTNNVEFFGDALYNETIVTQRIQPSPIRNSFLDPSDAQFGIQGIDPALLIFPSNPNYQIAANYLTARGGAFAALVGQPLAITERVFNFGPRTSEDTSWTTRVTGGLRGQWMKQDWALAYTYNENKLKGYVPDGYFSQTAYATIVQTSNDWNPWSLTQSPAFQARLPAAKYTGATQDAKSEAQAFDASITGEVFNLPAGPVQYAGGYQYRKESIVTNPSDALFSGDIAGLGGATPPIDRDRNVNAVYAELNVPIVKTLEATGAVRYDKYNDVGNSTTWKGTLRWQPTREWLLRGSAGTGFRAPSLADLWLPQTVGTSEQFTDPAFPDNRDVQVPNLSGGNPALKPETSKQYSVGFVWAPLRQVSFGVDYWRIKLEDIITTPSAQEVVSQFRLGDASYASLVRLTPGGEVAQVDTFLYNTGGATVVGYDIDATYRDSFSWGNFYLNLRGTYMDQYDEVSPGGFTSHKVGTLVDPDGNPVLGASDGGVILRWKHVLTATWSQGPWSATFIQNWYNGYQNNRRQRDGEPHFVSDQQIYDLYLAYTGVKNLRLAIGARNIFDKDPPIFVPASNQFQAGYDVNQYDPRGRFVYATIGYKFF